MEVRAELVGRQVGDFRLVDLIGEGGMGAAYRAEQVTLGREAVVKVLSAPAVSEQAKVRFLREARLASRLDHPYAAHVYAFGAESDGLLWIAMELVRGVPLDRMIEEGAIPLARFVPLFDRLCEVVYSAHEQGIIHRDIKPGNVMVVRRAGRLLPKLLDFGIARAEDIDDVVSGNLEDPDAAGQRAITQHGRLGSPGYMAPETWLDSKQASPRSDLYSLAITGYEMLTARRLFDGATVLAIARAHARGSIAPLGPGFPVELDRVFARALAKKPAQRYDNVLELGAAIREAARAAASETATDFDEAVRDAFISGGPQPIAEALLDLSAARGPSNAWDAGWRVVDVLVRAVGIIALAARAGIGDRALRGDTAARVRALVERGLDRDEWLELVGALLEPFATNAQAHPLPELVAAFVTTGEARVLISELRQLPSADAIDAKSVQALMERLGKILRACAFLTDYSWVVVGEHGGESWMGPRRTPRERRKLDSVAAGTVWMLDRDGAPVVQLSPLVHVAPPSPGADDEMFLLDGPARRGARSVAWPREFERYDEELLRYVAEHLTPLADRAANVESAAPYRGLASFGPGDSSMFYGREREVEAVVNRLRMQPLIAVVGPSGVGKSSFVHAGVLPALPETWQTLTLRPGAFPLTALESRLTAAGIAGSGLAEKMRVDPAALGNALDDAAHRQGTRIVIVIDQLEEMFTQCRDVETRDQLARALAGIGSGRSGARAILTLRDDFLVRAAELPELGTRLATGLELVTLPDPTALARILVEPLRQVGYTFESGKMPDEMIAEVREHPGALALLSFAASKLWELRDRQFHHIPRRAYESIGGVVGALAKHAEDTLSALPESDHKLVRELFRQLVTSEGTRATLSRAEAIQLLGKGAAAEHVIETLVERRLIVAYEADAKTERIEVIHEALLNAWPRLVTWQREDAEGARMRDQVRSAARQWGERGRPKGLLWRGEALVELKLWRARHGGALTDLEHAFVAASVADEARARRLRRIALATVFAGLAIGMLVLQRANGVARRNAEASRRSELAMIVEQGRTALLAGHPEEAMVYLSSAYSQGAEDPNLPFMLGAGEQALAGQLLVMRTNTLAMKGGAFTPDGAHIISKELEGAVDVWNARTGALEHALPGSNTAVMHFVPRVVDDHRVLTFGPDEKPAVWDLATGTRRFELPIETGVYAQASSDGATIVTLEHDKLRTWSATDGTPRIEIALPPATESQIVRLAGTHYGVVRDGRIFVGAFDATTPPIAIAPIGSHAGVGNLEYALDSTGKHLAVVDDRTVRLYDVEHPEQSARVLAGHAGPVWRIAFSPDATRLVTASGDHTAKIWDVATGALQLSLDGHDGYIFAVAWSPDGERIATGAVDHTARVWDVHTGAPLAVLHGSGDTINSIAFDRTGDHVITSSNDGSLRVFDAKQSRRGIELGHEGPLTLLATADAKRVLILADDSRAWLYDVATATVTTTLGPYRNAAKLPRGSRRCGGLDATGTLVVIPTGTEALVVRLADPEHPTSLQHASPVTCARVAPDGRIVTALEDGHVVVWTADGKLERTLTPGTQAIADVTFDRQTTTFATASGDGVTLYDLRDLDHPRTLPDLMSPNALAFSHDGTRLAVAGDDTVVRVGDVATGAVRFGSRALSAMNDVGFGLDDRRVIVADNEGTLSVYDSVNGRLLDRFGDFRDGGRMTGVIVDAGRIISADERGHVRTWPITLETRAPAVVAHETACAIPLHLVENRLIPGTLSSCK